MTSKVNLLITGGLGFIGSNFINYIFPKGIYKIIVIDNLINCGSIDLIDTSIQTDSDFIFVNGSINDVSLVTNTLTTYNITKILNLAATQFQPIYEGLLVEYVQNNVMNLTTFLNTCLDYGNIELFIHMSTIDTSPNTTKSLDSVITSKTCYHEYYFSKQMADQIVVLYRDKFKLPIVIAASNYIFGETQCLPAQVPTMLTHLNNNEKIPVRINNVHLGNYLYINNVNTAYEILLIKATVGKVYQIVADSDGLYTQLSLAKELIKKYTGTEDYVKWIDFINENECIEDETSSDNCLLKDLGWSPGTSTSYGLSIMVNYYKNL